MDEVSHRISMLCQPYSVWRQEYFSDKDKNRLRGLERFQLDYFFDDLAKTKTLNKPEGKIFYTIEKALKIPRPANYMPAMPSYYAYPNSPHSHYPPPSFSPGHQQTQNAPPSFSPVQFAYPPAFSPSQTSIPKPDFSQPVLYPQLSNSNSNSNNNNNNNNNSFAQSNIQMNTPHQLPLPPVLVYLKKEYRVYVTVLNMDGNQWKETKEAMLSSRALRVAESYGVPTDHFVKVNFGKKSKPDYIKAVLANGLPYRGAVYGFAGYTNSSFKDKQAWFLLSSNLLSPQKLRDCLGKFEIADGHAKYGSRVALSFAPSVPTISLLDHEYFVTVDSRARDNTLLTDGCGFISRTKANEIKQLLGLSVVPQAYQIRFRGFKGVLTISNTLPDEAGHHVIFHTSMQKFNSSSTISPYNKVDVLNYSTPSSAKISQQLLRVLLARGVPTTFFQKILDEEMLIIKSALDSTENAAQFLQMWKSVAHDRMLAMLAAGFHPNQNAYLKKFLLKSRITIAQYMASKLQLSVKQIKYCIGVCDPSGLLPPDMVYYERHGKPLVGRIAIGRHPMYHCGDLRIVQAVDVPELHGMEHVLVFSTNAKSLSSIPNSASGGDLDGDSYFVIYNQELLDLIEKEEYPALDYEQLAKDVVCISSNDTDEQVFFKAGEHLATFNSQLLGTVDKYLAVWCDYEGIDSEKCERLARIASQCLDAPKTGMVPVIPDELKPPYELTPHYLKGQRHSSYFLGQMYDHLIPLLEYNGDVQEKDKHLLQKRQDNVYLEFEKKAKQHFKDFKREVARILASKDPNEKEEHLGLIQSMVMETNTDKKIQEAGEKIREKLFSTIDDDDYHKMARAVYAVSVEDVSDCSLSSSLSSLSISPSSSSSSPSSAFSFSPPSSQLSFSSGTPVTPTSTEKSKTTKAIGTSPFAWIVAGDYLCEIKAREIAKEDESGKMRFSVAPSCTKWFSSLHVQQS